jgi:hypothetical protein
MQQAPHRLAIKHFEAEVRRALRPDSLLETDNVPMNRCIRDDDRAIIRPLRLDDRQHNDHGDGSRGLRESKWHNN